MDKRRSFRCSAVGGLLVERSIPVQPRSNAVERRLDYAVAHAFPVHALRLFTVALSEQILAGDLGFALITVGAVTYVQHYYVLGILNIVLPDHAAEKGAFFQRFYFFYGRRLTTVYKKKNAGAHDQNETRSVTTRTS